MQCPQLPPFVEVCGNLVMPEICLFEYTGFTGVEAALNYLEELFLFKSECQLGFNFGVSVACIYQLSLF